MPRAPRKTVLVQAWIDPALEKRLSDMADKGHRTRAAELTLAIEKHVAEAAP